MDLAGLDMHSENGTTTSSSRGNAKRKSPWQSPRLRRVVTLICITFICVAVGGGWLSLKAKSVKEDLEVAAELIPKLKQQIAASDTRAAQNSVAELQQRTSSARDTVSDPLWTLAAGLPWIGVNFGAVAEVARSADDVSTLGLAPLVNVYASLDWEALLPTDAGANLEPLKTAAPVLASSAYAVQVSAERLEAIDRTSLLPEVSDPVMAAAQQLRESTGALNLAADVASTVPAMMGAETPKSYLLMIQNNAESRASGGIPGALAILAVENGKLSLGAQSSAGGVGIMSPSLPVDPEQQQIFTTRLGKFIQDVNLTPDFPTAAATARAIWERKTGQQVDGVMSIDPVALSYILQVTGPVSLGSSEVGNLGATGLPSQLDSSNVVQTLLSDVYDKIEQPELQDAYFAGVAKEVFTALSSGKGDTKGLIAGITRGVEEGRILLWSNLPDEQAVIAKYALSGSIDGPSISPAQFGVYFNDGTGAKMDFYIRRTVQLLRQCGKDGYEETLVRVTSTNTAPSDASTSLPDYVTAAGAFGVPPGSVQTNVVAYGPVQAQIETALLDGRRIGFAPYIHRSRPVGVYALRLAPGETKTLEFTFGKIVQHTEPELFVTPTVQPVSEVRLPTKQMSCT